MNLPLQSQTSGFRLARLLLVLLLVVFLGSCSTARLGYSNADTLSYWWLDGYVDFRASQKAKVKQDIARLLRWHRSTQLPQYVQVLKQMQATLVRPSVFEIEASFVQVEQFSQTILLQALPELSDFMLSMDESQRAFLARKFEKNNEDYRDKYVELSPEQQTKKRFKKIVKQVDEWLGSVSREQEAMISRHLEKHPPNYALWLDDSKARQRGLLQLLAQIQKEKPSREVVQTWLQRAIQTSFETSDQHGQRTQSDVSRGAIQQLMVDIIQSASQQQKTHAQNKLQDWINDIQYLIAHQ
ncbi:DUF6279 family lipoprotein [Undibacterium fentianense]|uniref:Lipoprotein n=1 Tax=Undibacterium fentianense TaxID=2828728 RepID=A0A941IDX8_9BURK|nr:DUF6279 family lipoprotein [Undibacterium fentianense]MBR7800463.1 hypothetical protein [Undibacterium fentianense]